MRLALDLALAPLPAMPGGPTREQLKAILNGNGRHLEYILAHDGVPAANGSDDWPVFRSRVARALSAW